MDNQQSDRREQIGVTIAGRYEAVSILGKGGMGIVYEARDTLLDRTVAIKTVLPHNLYTEEASRRFFREAQALARLNHPNILTIFDYGQDGDLHYLVMELGGKELGIVLAGLDSPLPVRQGLIIAMGVCRALDTAHNQGIIHRDLKPANILVGSPVDEVVEITDSMPVKVMDFGLAKVQGATAITGPFAALGTAHYMSPEQSLGQETDARSDLYSLGVLLYELFSGILPFDADDAQSILAQHLNLEPVTPSTFNPEIPQALESLIMRLIAKEPDSRPASASEVIDVLESISLDSQSSQADVSSMQPAHVTPALAPMVGRDGELGALKAAYEAVAAGGGGRLLMVAGEPGIGKTRLVEELARYVALRGGKALWGRCYEDRGTPPYWPWVQPIREYARERPPDQLRTELGIGGSDMAELVSELRERLPDLKPSPRQEDPEQARFRMFDSIATFFRNVSSSGQPLVIALEDLHWSDRPSLMLLEFIAKEIAGSKILIVGTYRDMELNRRHPLSQTLGELTRTSHFQRVLLRGLTSEQVSQFVETASGITPPDSLVKAVYQHTEGNPLFVTEIVRLLVQEGALNETDIETRESVQQSSEQAWEIRIPEGVREVIGRRLDRLSEQCNDVLSIASVIGREFTLRQLVAVHKELSQDQLLDVLEEAVDSHVVEEITSGVGRYQFTHALVRETLTEELSLTRRVRMHARIAESLEELYKDNTETRAAELAYHFTQAEMALDTERMVRYSIVAGERAISSNASEEALVQLGRNKYEV